MIAIIVGLLILVLFSFVDSFLYSKAPFPQRTKFTHFPGSGFIAYFVLRRKQK